MNHDVTDFETEVIGRSETTPILVDFWAPWCGPCKMLAPSLEKLAAAADGRWELAKVNTDENPDLAERFEIRGIPNLKLFHHGAVIAELAGALPEPQLRAWLEQHLPTQKRQTMARARELLHDGRAADAARLLEPLVAAEPADEELAVLTARALVFSKPAVARTLAGRVDASSPWSEGARHVEALAVVLASSSPSDGTAAGEHYHRARAALRTQDFRTAAAEFIEVLGENPEYDDGRAKAACRALFQHLGIRHPITEEFSRAFSMAVNV